MPTPLQLLFGEGLTDAQYADKLDSYKSAFADSYKDHDANRNSWTPRSDQNDGVITKRAPGVDAVARLDTITKSLGADSAAGITAELDALRAELVKDWTPTNPVGGTGLTPYDLEGPAKLLVPLHTPLRNAIPRTGGKGNARKFKRVDSFSNAGVPGGAASLTPFFNSLTGTSTWGPTNNVTLARPPKISYTGTDITIPYVELGLSDSVDWITQFEGLGFDDVRALSHTALLYAHMMGEERAMLFGRGSQTGYKGAVAAPVTTVSGSGTGGNLATNTYFVYVAAVTGFGQSPVSAVQNSGALTGPTASVTVTVATEPTGSLGLYALYVGTVTGIANAHFQGNFTGTSFVLTNYNAAGAVTAGTDTSADANAYDGLLTVQSDPTTSGYFARVNAALSTTNPGSEIDTALYTMYGNNAADPDEIWTTGAVRTELNQIMRKGGASGFSAGYRTNVVSGDGSVTMGTVVSGFLNANTGKVIDVKTHRFMPAGNLLLRSTSLPLPDPHISAPVMAVNVQDYMAVDWPNIQMTYDQSTYQIGTLVHYAPAWSGLLVGIA